MNPFLFPWLVSVKSLNVFRKRVSKNRFFELALLESNFETSPTTLASNGTARATKSSSDCSARSQSAVSLFVPSDL
jgi:hypothetical protein